MKLIKRTLRKHFEAIRCSLLKIDSSEELSSELPP